MTNETINEILKELQPYIQSKTKNFLKDKKLVCDYKDVVQFVNIELYLLLKKKSIKDFNKKKPLKGDSFVLRYSKKSINYFLLRFQRSYYLKKNKIEFRPFSVDRTVRPDHPEDVKNFVATLQKQSSENLSLRGSIDTYDDTYHDLRMGDTAITVVNSFDETFKGYKKFEYYESLKAMMDMLDDQEKALLLLMIDEDFSYSQAEIGSFLGVHQYTISKRMSKLRVKLEKLHKEYF